MQVRVTKKDIQNGLRERSRSCPIALAINRRTKNKYIACVCGYNIYLRDKENEHMVIHELKAPPKVLDFLCAFDNGDKVVPFNVELDI